MSDSVLVSNPWTFFSKKCWKIARLCPSLTDMLFHNSASYKSVGGTILAGLQKQMDLYLQDGDPG